MYKYYQKVGGNEPWTPIQANLSLDEIRPTFVTILAVDTLMEDDCSKEVRLKAKYAGPMYFDLDAQDISESISDAKQLVKLLQEHELTGEDFQIFLSGKKGFHILVPEVCFMAKPGAVQTLPAIYKEIAFKLAVDTLDFNIYSTRRGRQFRTCYNVRENGNYKVPITLKELESLTAETYDQLCKAPRVVDGHNPKWRGRFSLLYDAALQKVSKSKPKAVKPVPLEVIKQQLPIFTKVASGEAKTDIGFNKIAIQLCLYAREMGWTDDRLVESCQGLIQKHSSDGSRYNTAYRRERELRRMYSYLDDNSGFEYSTSGLKSCIKQDETPYHLDDQEDSDDQGDFGGVYQGTNAYMAAKGEDGDVKITNFIFRNIQVLRTLNENTILGVKAEVKVRGATSQVFLLPTAFTGGSAFQNAISVFGGSFSGTDIHARGVFQAMLHHAKKDQLVLDSEGINYFSYGEGERKRYVVWADRDGVRDAGSLSENNINIVFQGYPDPKGLYRTDLTSAPTLKKLMATVDGKARFTNCVLSMMKSHTPEVMGKLIGWAVASFYSPIFHANVKQFPLLHVYGPAGNGKTSTIRALLRMFYYKEDIKETTPNSSIFSFMQMAAGSASIPLLLDEYKPHKMGKEKLEPFRGILRDAFNAKTVQRGGGNRTVKDNFNALSTVTLSAPLAFIAEAPETETAIVERSVSVSFKRLAGRQQAECFKHALLFQRDPEPLASLGLEIANEVVSTADPDVSLQPFQKAVDWAYNKFLAGPDDWEKVAAGEMTQEEMRLRSILRPRSVFCSTVAFFGLRMLRKVLLKHLGEELYKEKFDELMENMSKACFYGMELLAEAALPEYVKILSTLSDMSRLPETDNFRLIEGIDYNISEFGEMQVLVLAHRQCYMKYRTYMKHTSSECLYPSDESFVIAMREIPQYVKASYGTKRLEAPTSVFDLEGLYRAAVTKWHGRATALDI